MVRTDISKSSQKNFHINPNTHSKALEIWEKWRRNQVNVSERLSILIERYDEAEERVKLLLENGGLTSNEAFLANRAAEEAITTMPDSIIKREEERRQKQLEKENAIAYETHMRDHRETIQNLKLAGNVDGIIEFCEEYDSSCSLCREVKEKMERIKRSHFDHKAELEEAIKRGGSIKYSPILLDFYKSHYDDCLDCRERYDETVKEYQELTDKEKQEIQEIIKARTKTNPSY